MVGNNRFTNGSGEEKDSCQDSTYERQYGIVTEKDENENPGKAVLPDVLNRYGGSQRTVPHFTAGVVAVDDRLGNLSNKYSRQKFE
ncbi:unnamed protein product [Acanthocheilonema viteae]|uniref:Uncharacterized protein n=1 Tax=Acanthocheilonema viteae TaxID=6277 RepID=A0A498S6M3_ACAVI|nr:unnamed protein product [Acanthocheilonema viteae]